MTAACETCCPDSYSFSFASPSEFAININETQDVTFFSVMQDCRGQQFPPLIDHPDGADISNPSVANFDNFFDLEVRGLSPGSCVFNFYFSGKIVYSDSGDGSCRGEPPFDPTADVVVEVQCNIPTGTTQASDGWVTVGQHKWLVTLLPTTTNWAGRRFREVSYAPSVDGCHFQNSLVPHVPLFLPTTIFTLETNQFTDFVGYVSAFAVDYYRDERPLRGLPLPCEYNDFQEDEMFCGDVPMPYGRRVLVGRIGATTIFSGRGDQGAGRTWP